jgi:hypothetical protein
MVTKTQPLDTEHEHKTDQSHTTLMQDQLKQKQKEAEVAGKHKNDGQKDHKGAR